MMRNGLGAKGNAFKRDCNEAGFDRANYRQYRLQITGKTPEKGPVVLKK